VDHVRPDPQWTGHGRRHQLTRAWPPAAPVLKDAGQGAGEGEWDARKPDCPLTGAWEAVRRPSDDGEGGGGQNSSAGRAQARRVGNGSGDECGEDGASSSPFYKGRGGVEAYEWGGDRPAAMVMAINGHSVRWGGEMEG
jgi:hypothetical protein